MKVIFLPRLIPGIRESLIIYDAEADDPEDPFICVLQK